MTLHSSQVKGLRDNEAHRGGGCQLQKRPAGDGLQMLAFGLLNGNEAAAATAMLSCISTDLESEADPLKRKATVRVHPSLSLPAELLT